MIELTEDQKRTLLRYREKIKEAQMDLDDSMKTEFMSDTKSSIYALEQEENIEDLPDEINEELMRLAVVAWDSVVGAGSVYSRIANTNFIVAEIERYVDKLLDG
ncbi:MAG: hypothetical protein OQK94_03495 [Gammaproteobacteria bacterium]|nr:hypothetical protein [Gammaproteobacteria bacterium]MCW8839758.1 hypothetical protein [Gammaproteobacteria bacterium]MCW8959280.1 hypothetical protein [Gammaproteobacteria bacterium]MCW8992429.1 hypothetical protein [Gammaproteobacteria bacterium]